MKKERRENREKEGYGVGGRWSMRTTALHHGVPWRMSGVKKVRRERQKKQKEKEKQEEKRIKCEISLLKCKVNEITVGETHALSSSFSDFTLF